MKQEELTYSVYKKAKRNYERKQKKLERQSIRLQNAIDKKRTVQLFVRGAAFFTYLMFILILLGGFLTELSKMGG